VAAGFSLWIAALIGDASVALLPHDSLPPPRSLPPTPSHPLPPSPSTQFSSTRFENGGFLPHCNQALAFAKGASELRCYAKAMLADGSVNRGT